MTQQHTLPSDELTDQPGKGTAAAPAGGAIASFILVIVIMVALMHCSITYAYPSGKHLDVVGFVTLWFREILILGFVAIGLLVLLVARLLHAFQSMACRWRGKRIPSAHPGKNSGRDRPKPEETAP